MRSTEAYVETCIGTTTAAEIFVSVIEEKITIAYEMELFDCCFLSRYNAGHN